MLQLVRLLEILEPVMWLGVTQPL
ncbi:hypothetical protein Golax_015754 [Gossypium laxum]|nr:hypothetical protein [Gossypium laxum]